MASATPLRFHGNSRCYPDRYHGLWRVMLMPRAAYSGLPSAGGDGVYYASLRLLVFFDLVDLARD